MTRIRVARLLPAPPAEVWADIRQIETHVDWMHDASAIRFEDDQRVGSGVAFDCDTRIGPFTLTDRMEITEWIPESVMGVCHRGVVTGTGRFTLEALGADQTRFEWDETLRFPWWMGGPVGGLFGGAILRRVWRRNLRNLADRFSR